MKKYGRKQRKIQKEKAARRAKQKQGIPFSKARNVIHFCAHCYDEPVEISYVRTLYSEDGLVIHYSIPIPIVQKWKTKSRLIPFGENECVCSKCGKRFPIERYMQMEKLLAYLSDENCEKDEKYIAELSRGLEPVRYRRISETENEILETVENEEHLS